MLDGSVGILLGRLWIHWLLLVFAHGRILRKPLVHVRRRGARVRMRERLARRVPCEIAQGETADLDLATLPDPQGIGGPGARGRQAGASSA